MLRRGRRGFTGSFVRLGSSGWVVTALLEDGQVRTYGVVVIDAAFGEGGKNNHVWILNDFAELFFRQGWLLEETFVDTW